jgi:hypothetical protein
MTAVTFIMERGMGTEVKIDYLTSCDEHGRTKREKDFEHDFHLACEDNRLLKESIDTLNAVIRKLQEENKIMAENAAKKREAEREAKNIRDLRYVVNEARSIRDLREIHEEEEEEEEEEEKEEKEEEKQEERDEDKRVLQEELDVSKSQYREQEEGYYDLRGDWQPGNRWFRWLFANYRKEEEEEKEIHEEKEEEKEEEKK